MKYIRLFSSHADYENAVNENPSVIYDGEHLHWINEESESTTTTTTTTTTEAPEYTLTVEITDDGFGDSA